MSKLTDELSKIGIHNPHNLTQKGHPFIHYHPREPRTCRTAAWVLCIKGKIFKDTAWYENGNKHFSVYNKDNKEPQLQAAITLAEKLCPEVKMVKGPWKETWVTEDDLLEATKLASGAKNTADLATH